ncbi:iron ABC transporter permease [Arachnia propionica]|uniref:FecCD family ABC transporter permease n=1 Tax=Arachnia propionica TaxID=1750 RepID=UPI0021AB35D1|nr:iron ABC transporter permease [Arachnia propionica]
MSGDDQPDELRQHHRIRRRRILILLGLSLLLVLMYVVAMLVGPMNVRAEDIVRVHLGLEIPSQTRVIVFDLRTPPALMAVLVGAALGLAGAQMQTILDNPLAEPFTLGVSAAAGCGAAVVIATGVTIPFAPSASVALGAAGFALIASLVIAGVSRARRSGRETIILLGIALVFGFQAVLMLLQYGATTESLQRMVFWTLGSLMRANWVSILTVLGALVVITPMFVVNQAKLTALTLGESRARAMGIKVDDVRMWSLLGASLLAAVSVSAVGIIGFIGLVGPHVARMLVGEDQRLFVPTAMTCGALVLCTAHAVAQVVLPGVVLPVGILTAMVGVPIFVLIIMSRRRTTSAIAT